MKLTVVLSILVVSVLALAAEPAGAASELELWCTAQGGLWEDGSSKCTVSAGAEAAVTGTLKILDGEALYVDGTINNNGVVQSYGYLRGPGIFNNHGLLELNRDDMFDWYGPFNNYGTFDNRADVGAFCYFDVCATYTNFFDGNFRNSGSINAINGFTNLGLVDNRGTLFVGDSGPEPFTNQGVFHNAGVFYNISQLSNEGVINNGGTIFNNNHSLIDNKSTIYNRGIIDNVYGGTFDNDGALYIQCPTGVMPLNLEGTGVVYDLQDCSWLSMLTRS